MLAHGRQWDGLPTGLYAAGYRQVWRVCSDGYRTRVWEKIVPRINDSILDCGIYLYGSKEDAEQGAQAGGSGFLVGLPFNNMPPNTWWHCYAVTNAHVIRGGFSVVRVNSNHPDPQRKTTAIPLIENQWIVHPDGDDLAIASMDLDHYRHRFNFMSPSLDGRQFFMTQDIQAQIGLGTGDEVFMTGRFMPRDESGPNAPLARFGHLATSRMEAISTEYGGIQESFLAEIHSIAGFSGSPVYVRVPVIRVNPGTEEDKSQLGWALRQMARGLDYQSYFLGVDWGHLGTEERDFPGMTGIVPAWKLTELLESDRVLTMRDKEEKRIAKKQTGKLDVRPNQRSKGGIEIPIPSKGEVMDVFKKATRKRDKK